MTREEYLNAATALMSPWFNAQGYPLPPVRVSVGIPAGGKGGKLKRIGECWSPAASADATTEVFICPSQSNATNVLAILVHELVHAAVGLEHGHKGEFKRLALALGLEGKMTSTTAGVDLTARLTAIISQLGAYPHAALNTALSGRKKQSTRMIKLVCDDCGWTCRTAQKNVDAGLPVCHCGGSINVA